MLAARPFSFPFFVVVFVITAAAAASPSSRPIDDAGKGPSTITLNRLFIRTVIVKGEKEFR